MGCGGHCVSMYMLPPHQLCAFMTINVTPLALMCNCVNVASLQLVLVGWVSLLGDSGVLLCMYICFGRILAF